MKKNNNSNTDFLYKGLSIIPGIPAQPKPVKSLVSAALIVMCIFLLIPVSHKPTELVKKILEYSPAQEAKKYLEKSGPKAAYDFAEFYESLPGVSKDPGLAEIKAKAQEERSSWGYMGKEIASGLLGLEHHEGYAGVIKSATGMIPYAQDVQSAGKYANELLKEWQNYKDGKNIDTLHLGLATLGLVEIGLSLLPNSNPTIANLKAQTNTLIDSLKVMDSSMRNVVASLFEPALKNLANTQILNSQDWKGILDQIREKKDLFISIMDSAESGLNQFQQLANIGRKNQALVPVIVAASSNMEELEQYSEIAEKIAKKNPDLLIYGGTPALKAALRLEKENKFNIATLETGMKYGPEGLNAVGIIPMPELEKEIQEVKNPASASSFRLPGIVVFLIIAASILFLVKTWMPVPQKLG